MADQLKSKIQSDMKDAMRAKETARLGTIRMLMAAIKQKEVDERTTVSDTDALSIINKMIKQRKESAKQFHEANRPELAEKEEQEIEFLNIYLPEQLSDNEIDNIISSAISEAGATSMKDMGNVMNIVRPKVQGRADMGMISKLVKEKIA